jgi:hypothetical protein
MVESQDERQPIVGPGDAISLDASDARAPELLNSQEGPSTDKNDKHYAMELISKKFPSASPLLTERLSASYQEREFRLFKWKLQHDEDKRSGSQIKTTLLGDSKNSNENADPDTKPLKAAESARWTDRTHLPKEPATDKTKSHFICYICHLSVPATEATGEQWM